MLLHQQPVHVYCDNQGVIKHITNKTDIPYPRDAIRDDYPVFQEIYQQITQLQPIIPHFHHMKGHQDTKSDWPITLPETLNVDCNCRASLLPIPYHKPGLTCNPTTEYGYPHLILKDQLIIRQLQHTLCDAATYTDYTHYLTKKFQLDST